VKKVCVLESAWLVGGSHYLVISDSFNNGWKYISRYPGTANAACLPPSASIMVEEKDKTINCSYSLFP